jgi:hypothetical protein
MVLRPSRRLQAFHEGGVAGGRLVIRNRREELEWDSVILCVLPK